MIACTSCGAELPDGAQFCTKCGVTLLPSSSQGVGQSAPSTPFATAAAREQYAATPGGQRDFDTKATPVDNTYEQASDSIPEYQPGVGIYSAQQFPAVQLNQSGVKADPVMRLGAFVIDILALIILMIPIAIFGVIPFLGWIIVLLGIPVVAVTYHLLRDIKGQSLGKYLLGLKVVSKNGGEAPNSSRVVRNILFAIPAVFMIVPLIGHFIGALLGFVIVITESIMLLTNGERLGDRFANTTVIKIK